MFRLKKVLYPDIEIPRGRRLIRARQWLRYLQARSVLRECRAAVENAQVEINRVYEKEKLRGYQDGAAAAKVDMAKEIHRFSEQMQDRVKSLEDGVADLVLELVGKIIINIPEPERVTLMIQQAMSYMREREKVSVMVSPGNADYVRESMKEIASKFGVRNEVYVKADSSLEGDECVLEGGGLVVEISLRQHLEALQRSLQEG